MPCRHIVGVALLLFGAAVIATSQTLTSSIFGTVIDSQGAVVAQVTVTAMNVDQNISASARTNNDGSFVFPELPAGRYTLTVEKAGFKKFEKTDVILDAFTNLNVGKFTLQIGAVTETVTVEAQGLQLQTESGERSGTVIGKELENLEVNGRSPIGLLKTVPGIRSDLNTSVVGIGIGNVYSNGSRGLTENVTLNGAANQDMGGNSRFLATLSLEALSEFRVLTGSYDARYGRSSGAQIIYVTKSGTQYFHGEGYWYYRDASMNANSWDNNRRRITKPPLHFNYAGYNIGGPAYIPGKFNTHKDKLFFFWSDEYQPQTFSTGAHLLTVPTANERLGNFSNPYNAPGGGCPNGDYLNITASAGPQCKALNVPSGAIPYGPGLAALTIYPLPNVNAAVNCPNTTYTSPVALALTGGGACLGGYNYISQLPNVDNRHEQLLRIDSNLSQKWRLFGSYTHLVKDPDTSPYCPSGSGYSLCGNVPLVSGGYIYNHPGHVLTANVTGTLSSATTIEGQFNYSHRRSSILPAAGLNGLSYAAFGITNSAQMLPTIFPPFPSWIPNLVFGENISNAPVLRQNGEWAPFFTYASPIEWIGNFSKVWNKHLFQAGLYVQRMHKNQTAFASTPGTYNFVTPNATSPGDTGYGYANAAYGLVSSFYQANAFVNGQYRYTNVEEYVQDTWKVTPRFTLVYGVRLYWVQPQYDQALQTSTFLPNRWNQAQAPRLYYRLNCPNTIDPSCTTGQEAYDSPLDGGTGATAAPGYIGRIVPGSGNLLNGIAQGNKGVNKYLMQGTGLLPGPRLGVTVDLTGRSNLVFRGGGGMYYDRYQGNEIFNMITNPPAIQIPNLVNVNASNITSGSGAGVPPGVPGLTAISYEDRVPTTYSYNAGIQAKLPWATVLDISYVGSMGRRLLYNWNINAVSYGADFLSANQDPAKVQAKPSALLGTNAYDGNFLHFYRGFGGVTIESFGATSNYNSLQVAADRRFVRGLFLSANYTYGKCLTWASDDGASTRIDGLNPRVTNWGRCSFDVAQSLNFSYVYVLPSLAAHVSHFNNAAGRAIFGGWQISGITSFQKGLPFAPSLSNTQFTINGTTYNTGNVLGTGDAGLRVALIGNPLAGTTSGPYNRLNPAAFNPPTVLPPGTTAGTSIGACPAGNRATLCLFGSSSSSQPLPFSIGLDGPVNYLTGPGVNNWDISLQKTFPLRERLNLRFKVDAFNAFNHTQFSGINSSLNFGCTGVNVSGQPTGCTISNPAITSSGSVNSSGFGAVSGSRDPRILQISAKLEF